ncbi:MAG: aldo/keto reductase [Gammaproteobacteria bacterium]|jgi:diketogulonate reductase-like aldo/keto reductase
MYDNHSRRTFLKTLTALGLSGVVPSSVYSQGVVDAVIKRAIPGTNEMLPIVGFGSSAPVRQIIQTGPGLLTQLIETMIKHSASVIDTAPRQMDVDQAFGKVLSNPDFNNKLFVTSKIGLNRFMTVREVDKQGGIGQYQLTRRLFNRHPADLVQVESMTDIDIHWPTLRDLKDKGDARYIGITSSDTSDHEKMEAFMKSEHPDFIQVNYSLVEPEAKNRVLPLARDMGIAVLINSPFNGGEFFRMVRGHELPAWAADFNATTWAQFNLKYILGETVINSVLTETSKIKNMEDNLRGGMGVIPDAQTRKKMKAHFVSLKN